MEINYFISAKATATVQNINVSLSAEYQKRASTGSYLRSSKRILGRREEIHECNP